MDYASKNRYNASQVPPEWHGWLHYITDHTGDEVDRTVPTAFIYGISVCVDLSKCAFDDAAAAVEAKEIRG